jgi:serine-type D-Ala-D-Ala carboxypeptidase (penicillin-binding protein 5/6)
MSEMSVLQQGRLRRSEREAQARRARRRRRRRNLVLVIAIGLVGLLAFMASAVSNPEPGKSTGAARRAAAPPHPRPQYVLAVGKERLRVNLADLPRAGLLFDIRTGHVLWQHNPSQSMPIASLTKMMTALVVTAHSRPSDRVLISPAAVHFTGSGVGLLPLGKRVPELALLYGLLLPSGNDAAIALAQHVANTQTRFIAMMNAQARAMDLHCTHFSTVSGVVDQGNYSCATDLAVVAHAVLEQPVLRRIVASPSAILAFPIKHHKLFLYNNNPLMYLRYPGVDGVKTGFTTLAGPCLVAAARRGRNWFGVVLLHSVNPAGQAEKLLNAAFAAS